MKRIMAKASPETVWNSTEEELRALLDSGALITEPRTVCFYAPSFRYYKTSHYRSEPNQFPTISVTGTRCALNCKHCEAKVLETMHAAETPEKLFAVASQLRQNGALGCLVSGGCLPDGSVPLSPFISVIRKIKERLGLTVFVHTGIIDFATAEALKQARVDAALIDVIGDEETIREVCNLNASAKDYENSLKALHTAGLAVVPHIIVGLSGGKLKGEFHALRMIASAEPSAVVIIAFMPIHGTTMAHVKPPMPADIARVTATARLMFPKTPIALGCVRPKGKQHAETDILALKAGADAVAFPSEEAIRYAEAEGYVQSFSSYCCAQIIRDAVSRSTSK
ncbi:MAG: radical SAM protein [Candidatus Bathyarchaeota archaeon]|nr:radical SAM protein [Candidatus Bathyarchaeota archaeon]